MYKRNNIVCQTQVLESDTCTHKRIKSPSCPYYVGKDAGGDGYDINSL